MIIIKKPKKKEEENSKIFFFLSNIKIILDQNNSLSLSLSFNI